MGNYIVHKRRKIRHPEPDGFSGDAGRSDAIERAFAWRREAERLEGNRRQAAKMARALGRRAERRSTVLDWTSGRRRTAARVAGIVIISATAGLRTQSVSIKRSPNGAPSQLWDVDVRFENEDEFTFFFNDPTIPAQIDAIHLMRYAAPRIAEEILTGSATAGADDRNSKTVLQLAESYANKLPKRSSLSVDDRCRSARKRETAPVSEGRCWKWRDQNGLVSRICCKYEIDEWASASSLIFTASNRMLSRPLRESSMRV